MVLNKVLKLCRDRGITIFMLEREIGVSHGCIYHWADAKTYPSVDTLKKLADYFGVTIDELVK